MCVPARARLSQAAHLRACVVNILTTTPLTRARRFVFALQVFTNVMSTFGDEASFIRHSGNVCVLMNGADDRCAFALLHTD